MVIIQDLNSKKAVKIVYMLFLSRKRTFSLSLLYKLDVIVLRKEKLQELINNVFVTLPMYVEKYYYEI